MSEYIELNVLIPVDDIVDCFEREGFEPSRNFYSVIQSSAFKRDLMDVMLANFRRAQEEGNGHELIVESAKWLADYDCFDFDFEKHFSI
jgi:hypothetical protein